MNLLPANFTMEWLDIILEGLDMILEGLDMILEGLDMIFEGLDMILFKLIKTVGVLCSSNNTMKSFQVRKQYKYTLHLSMNDSPSLVLVVCTKVRFG